ncbi:hypothetical protein MKX01_034632 [Papaver californicum]|nr:hypothetical protein MKX01_034632 [Papaver californicum]
MPGFRNSLRRWTGISKRNPGDTTQQQEQHQKSSEERELQDYSNSSSSSSSFSTVANYTNPITNSIECYACTQVGVPVFHSTSCDSYHPPEWEASAGSSSIPIQSNQKSSSSWRSSFNKNRPLSSSYHRSLKGPLGTVLDPRTKRVKKWNRAFLLARAMALAIDPLFFYAISIGRNGAPCLYMDGGLAAIVTLLRTCVDAIHLSHLWLQFRLAYVSRESLVVGCGKLVWDARAIASHYVRSLQGFWFDVFVILPVPQTVFWLVVPKLIREEKIKLIMTILLLIFLFQFLPKVYHSICLMRRMQKVTGYVFGTIWWGFALNLIAYFIASRVAGGCWYVLAIQRVALCLRQQCEKSVNCNLQLACADEVCYRLPLSDMINNSCGNNAITHKFSSIPPVCLNGNGPFRYGIYKQALPVVSSNSLYVKILYPIFWGLMTLSIIVTLSGLLLFTLLIGNIQVFLHAVMARKRKMQLRCRDMEWWMKRRQLPSRLRQRVCHFERQKWAAMGGEDEMELIKDLPEGLRRDIKRHLCLDLFKKVQLFHNLDDLILDNLCDRVKPLVFTRDEKIIREGDPVPRMIFIMRGRLESSQKLSKGTVATCTLGPGNFVGDELLSWCLRRPFIDRLPASSATFVCVEATEAFGLDANHLRYITDHFRYKFANERLKRTARYYSSNWRTWVLRTRGPAVQVTENGDSSERKLRQYAAMFLSLRPYEHLE